MRKTISCFIMLFFCSFIYGQNVIVQTTGANSSGTKNETYKINGIPTTEDIGGVEVSASHESGMSGSSPILFENFNNFTVTVIFEVTVRGNTKLTGTIVLKANEKKETKDTYGHPANFKLIVRKLSN